MEVNWLSRGSEEDYSEPWLDLPLAVTLGYLENQHGTPPPARSGFQEHESRNSDITNLTKILHKKITVIIDIRLLDEILDLTYRFSSYHKQFIINIQEHTQSTKIYKKVPTTSGFPRIWKNFELSHEDIQEIGDPSISK